MRLVKLKKNGFPMPETAIMVIKDVLERAKTGKLTLKVPSCESGDRIVKGMRYHLDPELFIQISGCTLFSFPVGGFTLRAGEICIVPPKVGHSEIAEKHGGNFFLNLVVVTIIPRTNIHIANAMDGRPRAWKPISIESSLGTGRVAGYMEDICEIRNSENKASEQKELLNSIVQTLMLTLIRMLNVKDKNDVSDRIMQCKSIVAASLPDPRLNVRKIASIMKYSPDYLSNLFHRKTGKRLIEYINHRRVESAERLLKLSSLNIKEIAWSCGYTDAGYFARVFRARTGFSPRGYRLKTGEG